MNYRHAFHAGNFADLLKHAMLTALMRSMTAATGPLLVVDTHAGAGAYDLTGELARKTGEAEAGIVRLMAASSAPAAFTDLKAAVTRLNPAGPVRHYPGSPLLIAGALRSGDRYVACEIRPDDQAALRATIRGKAGVEVAGADGWATALERSMGWRGRRLVLIDPPFERADDYAQILSVSDGLLAQDAAAAIAVWLPIKDLATFDAFLGDLEDVVAGAPMLVAQVRLRPLSNPMKMNGCAMLVVNPPITLTAIANEAAGWIAATLGEPGAMGGARLIGA